MHKFKLLLAGVTILVASGAMASGGFSSLGSNGTGGARLVDEVYEYGKSIYKGRADGTEKIKYCVKVDGEVKKLKRSTVKPYRKGLVKDFALALIDCKEPERLALMTMEREHVPVVLYYLNKRYKLKLTDEVSG